MDDALVLKRRGYTLGISLGEGSYAKVKSAYSDRLKTNVAVKIINRRKAPADFLEKFLPREMEILAVLNHRNVVKTFEIFETSDGKVYMIMELGVQGDLLEFIKFRGALPEDFCRKLFRQLALAIKYIHDLDIVHRDLKCENLLLDKDFNIKVSDFGFCRRCHHEDANIVFSKTFCGSAAYAAPEVLQGIPYNPKVYDIWSMGVVLYIMLCGSMPYDDSNIKKMLKIQKEHRVDFPRTKNLAPECKDLIYRMLNPEVSRRIEIDEILDHAWLRGPRPKTQEAARKQADGPSTSRGYSRNGARGESRAENPSLGKKDAEPEAPGDAGAECEADAPEQRACKAPRDATDPEPPPCHRRKSSAHAKQTAHMNNEEHHR